MHEREKGIDIGLGEMTIVGLRRTGRSGQTTDKVSCFESRSQPQAAVKLEA